MCQERSRGKSSLYAIGVRWSEKNREKGGGIPFLLKSLEHPECYAPQQNQQTLPPYCLLTVH